MRNLLLLTVVTTALASSARAQAALQTSPLAIGESFVLSSKVLGESRRINVYLPPVYADSPGVRLPVLYMPDGGIAEDFLHVAGLVQVSIGNGTMRPFILVGIENTRRRRDLTGPTVNAEDRKIAPVVGGSAAFRRFIRTELMPAINAHYRTTTERAIIGESLAGLFIVETLFLEPDMFDTYVAFDPSIWWNNNELANATPARMRGIANGKRTLYLASSRDDRAGIVAQLAESLRKNGPPNLTVYFEAMPNESHATIYHPAALQAIRRLFKPSP